MLCVNLAVFFKFEVHLTIGNFININNIGLRDINFLHLKLGSIHLYLVILEEQHYYTPALFGKL